ncbi:hypothetical protein HanRHA438_Chr05g0205111 [Helianthus annuus]|nr:hypothetical protein HanRHA438_Chr05g0205111 [Helianthus annuus]
MDKRRNINSICSLVYVYILTKTLQHTSIFFRILVEMGIYHWCIFIKDEGYNL